MTSIKTANAWRFLIPIFLVSALFFSCKEEPGLVGASIIESEESFRSDTVFVDEISQETFTAYTGRLQRVAMGAYNDPIFGDVTITTLIKPALFDAVGVDSLSEGATMSLRFSFDSLRVWGDSTAPTQFNIYEVLDESDWRGVSYLYDDQIQFDPTPLATFTRTEEDTVIVPMPQTWADDYRELYNAPDNSKDSIFVFNYRGLVVEPQNGSSKVQYIDLLNTDLLIDNPGDTLDALAEVNIRDWAYQIDRQNQNIPADRLILNSENLILRSNFFEQLGPFSGSNIAKFELVLFEDTTAMESSLPVNHVRTDPLFLEVHQQFDLDQNFDITFGTQDSIGRYSEEFGTYTFNLTPYINRFLFGDGLNDDFLMSILERSGFITNSLIYDTSAGDAVRPRVIITSIEN